MGRSLGDTKFVRSHFGQFSSHLFAFTIREDDWLHSGPLWASARPRRRVAGPRWTGREPNALHDCPPASAMTRAASKCLARGGPGGEGPVVLKNSGDTLFGTSFLTRRLNAPGLGKGRARGRGPPIPNSSESLSPAWQAGAPQGPAGCLRGQGEGTASALGASRASRLLQGG